MDIEKQLEKLSLTRQTQKKCDKCNKCVSYYCDIHCHQCAKKYGQIKDPDRVDWINQDNYNKIA